jgi:Ca2+-binding EF-hand superfamily protein
MAKPFILRPTLRGMAAASLLACTVGAQAQTSPAPPGSQASAEAPEALFKRADKDGDGKLSRAEAAEAGMGAARFAELDADKDGFVTLSEFVAGTQPAK